MRSSSSSLCLGHGKSLCDAELDCVELRAWLMKTDMDREQMRWRRNRGVWHRLMTCLCLHSLTLICLE